MDHTYADVPGREGLAQCTTCRGAEGTLPSECPKTAMPGRVAERVYAGVLDFVDGRWVNRRRRGLVLRFAPWGLGPGVPLDAVDRWGSSSSGSRPEARGPRPEARAEGAPP